MLTNDSQFELKAHLSLVLICRALASILAPMSPMAFPLMSSLVRDVLLPRALRTMERSAFSLESVRDSEVSGCRGGVIDLSLRGVTGSWSQRHDTHRLLLLDHVDQVVQDLSHIPGEEFKI